MSYAMEPIHSDSDVSDSEEIIVQRTWTPKRIGLVAFGLTCLVASALAGAFALRPGSAKSAISARALLESHDMVTAQAKNQIKVLKLQDDEASVRMKVAKGINKIEEKMQKNDPAKWRQLNDVTLMPQHQAALVRMVSSITDPRVQELGHKVVKAFADGSGTGREGVKKHLSEIFSDDQIPQLRRLRNELFHGLRRAAPEGKKATFDADSMRMMKALPESPTSVQARRLNPDDLFDDSLAGDSDESSALGFFGALEEQARTLLDQIDFVGTSFGWDSQIPSEAKAGIGGLDFFTNVADCLSRAEGNDVKEGFCPMKYASAAFDSISAMDNEMGIDNGELGLDENFDGGNKGSSGRTFWDSMMGSGSSSSKSSGGIFGGSSGGSTDFFDSLFGSSPSSSPSSSPVAQAKTAFGWS